MSEVHVTAALTHVTDPADLGHVIEAVQTDIYVRARRMMGDTVSLAWAADSQARCGGVDLDELIAGIHVAQVATHEGFQVAFTVDGATMAKRRGTAAFAGTYLERLDPSYLRYHLAAGLSKRDEELELVMDELTQRVNTDLVGKAASLASRSIKFLNSRLDGALGPLAEDGEALVEAARRQLAQVPARYAEFDSAGALRLAMEMAGAGDAYINEQAPWKLIKQDPERARAILSVGVQISKLVAAALGPVLPSWATAIERMLKLDAPLSFANAAAPLAAGLQLGDYESLAERLSAKALAKLIEASEAEADNAEAEAEAEDAEASATEAEAAAARYDYEVPPLAAEAGIDALAAVDLRVAKIIGCETVPKANKLLKLTVDVGPLGTRQVFSGISKSYAPDQLLGKHVVLFANLAPRKMRFGLSEGMIMAAGESDDGVTVVELDPRSRLGDKIT